MEEKQIITEEMYITKWKSMLSAFEKIIKGFPTPEAVKEDLEALSEAASNTNMLTTRQKSGIVDRCSNYLKGIYGKDSIKSNYIQDHKQQ